jgi:hypothetical protein
MKLSLATRCALCHAPGPLRDSHIIPEFLYRTLYDEKHRFHTYGKHGKPELALDQKGFRERLLCDACECRFCHYEQFAAIFIRGAIQAFNETKRTEVPSGASLTYRRFDDKAQPTTAKVPTTLWADGVDYARLKLFLLSLVWRMGVSTLHFFHEVDLGPHEERLRLMLLKAAPGEPNEYPCQLCLVEAQGSLITDVQIQPRKIRKSGKTFYLLFSAGVEFVFCVSNRGVHPTVLECYCVKRQPYFVWMVDSIDKHPGLIQQIVKLGPILGIDQEQTFQ